MSKVLQTIGNVLKGRLSTYTIVKELRKAPDDAATYLALNNSGQKCILKSIRGHWRLRNEADVLKQYQHKSAHIRPLLDEIADPTDPPSIVLKYLDSDLDQESYNKRLSRAEIKKVSRVVLEALAVLHQGGMVHTDNVFLNLGGNERFSKIQLGDFGGAVSEQSGYARDARPIGAAYTRSPEVLLSLPWKTSTDIWSFGNMILALLYGGNYYLFHPRLDKRRHEDKDFELTALQRMYKFLGPFPASMKDYYNDNPNAVATMIEIMSAGPPAKPMRRVTPLELPAADLKFILKIMKMDPRDRPTARELLEDEWFSEESEDTRAPLLA